MIALIQILVILLAVIIVVVTLGNRSTHSGKAWKKIGLVFLAIAMIVAVLFPDTTNMLARLVGVGRGADLLLYVTVIAFILFVLNNYLYQQDQKNSMHKLARKVALSEAETVNRDRKL